MKGIIIIAPIFLKFIAPEFVSAMALYPFILVKNKKAKNNFHLINHERIHLKQQLECLLLPFYLWYGLEYIYRRLQKKNHYAAYRQISFEREAYANERDLDYLKNRKHWTFLKYIY